MQKKTSTWFIIWHQYLGTFLGGVCGMAASLVLKLFPLSFLSNLSGFFLTLSCLLLSYMWFHLRENKWKSHKGNFKKKQAIDTVLLLCMFVTFVALMLFWKYPILSWFFEAFLGIVTSYLLSAVDIIERSMKKFKG